MSEELLSGDLTGLPLFARIVNSRFWPQVSRMCRGQAGGVERCLVVTTNDLVDPWPMWVLAGSCMLWLPDNVSVLPRLAEGIGWEAWPGHWTMLQWPWTSLQNFRKSKNSIGDPPRGNLWPFIRWQFCISSRFSRTPVPIWALYIDLKPWPLTFTRPQMTRRLKNVWKLQLWWPKLPGSITLVFFNEFL